MKLDAYLKKLNDAPESVMLEDTLNTIDALYDFTPVAFSNGEMHNAAGEAPRSCRMYAFARLHGLTVQQTLLGFGEHYREVLADPEGDSHKTIRIFMRSGWDGLSYEGIPLKRRTENAA
jgi:hypothetical protein